MISGGAGIFDKQDYDAFEIFTSEHVNALITRNGVVYERGAVVAHSTYADPYNYFRASILALGSRLRRRAVKVDVERPVGIVHSMWTRGYYHWLTESIPRILHLSATYPGVPVILPRSHICYGDFLSLLGMPDPLYFPDRENVIVPTAILAACPPRMACLPTSDYTSVREALAPQSANVIRKTRIYISRKNARGRKIINEREVVALLEGYGFKEIAFENFSIREQIIMSSNAEALIGIHGAGLTNMIFAPAGGVVLELIPRKRSAIREFNLTRMSSRHDPCFSRLSLSMGHSYAYLECEPTSSGRRTSHMDDLTVDIKALEGSLRAAGL